MILADYDAKGSFNNASNDAKRNDPFASLCVTFAIFAIKKRTRYENYTDQHFMRTMFIRSIIYVMYGQK